MRFSIFQESKIGGRKTNQDRMGYCYTRECLLMVVADGMGGHLLGDMAAQITLQTIGSEFQKAAAPRLQHPLRFLEQSFISAHREILNYRLMHNLPESPRTTVVACVVQSGAAYWAHVGDSRLYWLRGGEVLAQTRDHSKIQSLIDQGMLTELEAQSHPDRNKLYNCLGSPETPSVELSNKMPLMAGDSLLLCSDGLWSVLSESVIVNTLATNTVMRAVPDLVQMALFHGGPGSDNVTGLAMTWEGSDTADETTGISTVTMPAGAVTTTIQADAVPVAVAEPDTLSEDEIDRAIREIRESIRNSNKTLPK